MSVIFFEFAGRAANMEAQRPHITALLDQNPGSRLDLWDLTRQASDAVYIREWAKADDRVTVNDSLHTGHPIRCRGPHRRGHRRCGCMIHKPPYEMPYKFYAKSYVHGVYDADTTFVKLDDDVIWMDTDKFPQVLEFLETRPNAIVSANVVNNAVCAKYEPSLHEHVREEFKLGGNLPQYDRDWWQLHTSREFAILSHQWMQVQLRVPGRTADRYSPVRTRPGEKISINFIAFKAPTMRRIAGMMKEGRLGDEGTVDMTLPWIIRDFRVAHLSFGPQEQAMSDVDLKEIRDGYDS